MVFFMKKLLSLSLIAILATSIFAQKSNNIEVIFNEDTHNFGTITDNNGEVFTEFTFVNLSQSPVIFKYVQASCGCTLPRYSTKPIAPNGTGKIQVGYNPVGRPGFFHKAITVKIGNDKETRSITLYITGNTVPHANRFAEDMSGLALGSRELSFGSMPKGDIAEKSFEIRNTTDKSMKIQFAKLPANITFEGGNSYTLDPKDSLEITATYDSGKELTFSDYSYPIEVKINGKTAGTIAAKANVKQPLDKLQEAFMAGSLPKIYITPRIVNLTTIREGERRSTKIKLTNKGNSELEIYSISSPNPNIEFVLPNRKNTINAGETIELDVKIYVKNMEFGRYNVPCQVVSNDPLQSITKFDVEFYVVK